MLELATTGQFRKDYRRVKKRGYDIYRDHGLAGNYLGFRECHILPDWLLVYAVNKKQLILTASRTGTHADLFEK